MPTNFYELMISSTEGMSTTGLILRVTLIVCSIFAMVHLISLWGTRYGDNHTLSKSFFLSLVLHGCFGLGWATVSESNPPRPIGNDPVVVQTPINLVDDIDSASRKGTHHLPVWQSGPSNSEIPLTRESRNSSRLDAENAVEQIQSPQINQIPSENISQELPSFPTQMEEIAPELDRSAIERPKSATSTPGEEDSPSREFRPEVSTKAIGSRASVNSIPLSPVEAPSHPNIRRGASQRAAATLTEGAVPAFPMELAPDVPPTPLGLPNEETIHRPESPDPVPIVDAKTGSGSSLNNPAFQKKPLQQSPRAARATIGTEEGRNDLPVRPTMEKRQNSDGNQYAETRTTEDRVLKKGISTESSDDSHQPKLEKPGARSLARAPARAPETYQARSLGQRMSSVLKNGGSEESERAVESSLKWLADAREPRGFWSAARYGGGSVERDQQGQLRGGDGKQADTGVTGLVVLSFLGAGYSHEKGPYTREIRDALDWLIDQQDKKDGYLGGQARNFDRYYCHAIATFALAEAYAMQKDANDYPELRNAVKLGVRKISRIQKLDGGWRYEGVPEGDMSMFGWQLMALKSAVNAGINVDEETRQGMIRFLNANASGKNRGLAGYKKGDPPKPAMTAEALFCRQMFAVRANDAAGREAVAYLLQNLPSVTEYDEYYWYYGTLAMRNADDESWQKWNEALRDMLVQQQRKSGPLAGSWDPRGKWAGIGGRLYSTAISTMCLEVYYRYQLNTKPNDVE